jgi:hypothetical protein
MLILLLAISSITCEHGIEPRAEPPRTGFSGMIQFLNNWPKDIYSTRIVAFKDTLKNASDFTIFNVVFISDSIRYGVKSFEYSSEKNRFFPSADVIRGSYKYICVAQSIEFGEPLRRDAWRVAGIYFSPEDSTKYGKIEIKEGVFLTNINITVDFNNPPIQPPK